MRTTVRLPDELLQRAKEKAAKDRTSLTALIEEGLRTVLDRRPSAARQPKLPRVSSARGGVRPGVDLTKTGELLDDDDLPLEKRR